MVRDKNTKGMVLLLLFFAATLTNAAPTMTGQNMNPFTFALSENPDLHAYTKFETKFLTGPVDSNLANIAAELNKPPLDVSDSPDADAGVKSLPHIPGAILMVLTGFICVSLVRDRKTWLTVLIALLGLGQAGFAVLPHLAQLLSNRKQVEKQSSDVAGLYRPQQDRLRSDIDDTYYIGLLRHLAGIPQAGQFYLQIQESGLTKQFCLRFTHPRTSLYVPYHRESLALAEAGHRKGQHYSHRTHLSAIITKPFSFIKHAINRLGTRTGQFDYIRSKFVFIALIRGPPHHS